MRNGKLKIVTIGGGSSYTPELIEGFIKRYESLPISELWLVDVPEGKEKLGIVGELAKRMVKEAGIPMEIHLTLDRREALKDADYVTTQFRVGLLDARIRDERIPLSYGVLGQETNGVGGMAKAMRTIPVIMDICNDMKELCPDAWLVNFTNPSGMVTEAVSTLTDIKVVGLCNVPIGMRNKVSKVLGYKNKNDISLEAAGLNHFFWGLGVKTPEGRVDIKELLEGYLKNESDVEVNITPVPWVADQIRSAGIIPCNYHRYYYNTDDMLGKQLEEIRTGKGCRGEQVKEIETKLFELYKNPDLKVKPKELEKRGGKHYSDAACELIKSLYNDEGQEIIVSRSNMYDGKKIIDCLPEDCAVEVTCNIHREGAIPYAIEIQMPPEIVGFLQNQKSFEQLTIAGSVSGDRGKLLQAMAINHLIPSGRITETILSEVIEKNIDYLPNF